MRRIAFLVTALCITLGSFAQKDVKPVPHMFVSLQGGVTKTYTSPDLDRKWAPMGALSFGGYFTRVVGARLQGNGWMWKQDYPTVEGNLHKYFGGNADLLVNLTNIFMGDRGHLIDVVALGGLGMHYADLEHEAKAAVGDLEKVKGDIWSMNLRLGGQLGVNLSKALAIQLEGGVHKVNDHDNPGNIYKKWWPYAMVGVAYRFGHAKPRNVAPAVTPVVQEVVEEQSANVTPAKPVVEKKPEPVVEKKPEPKVPEKQTENVFFRIGRSAVGAQQAATIDKIAQWAKDHPQATILLTGYADKATGTARVNQALSERRAAAVKDALVKRGISADRITPIFPVFPIFPILLFNSEK